MLKFPLGNLKTVRCEASRTRKDRRSCGLDVVGDIVHDWSVWGADLCEGRELRQQSEVRIVRVLGVDGRTGGGIGGEDTLYV